MKACVGLPVLYFQRASNPCSGGFTQKHKTKVTAKPFYSNRHPSCQLSIEWTQGQGNRHKKSNLLNINEKVSFPILQSHWQ